MAGRGVIACTAAFIADTGNFHLVNEKKKKYYRSWTLHSQGRRKDGGEREGEGGGVVHDLAPSQLTWFASRQSQGEW